MRRKKVENAVTCRRIRKSIPIQSQDDCHKNIAINSLKILSEFATATFCMSRLVYPHGTGSLLSEQGSGGTQKYARNKLTSIQSWFRKNALWGFWMMDRLVKTELFFNCKKRRESGRPCVTEGAEDPYKRLFGTTQPADIPETSEWWKRQQRNVFAMSDDAELGLMQATTGGMNPASVHVYACGN